MVTTYVDPSSGLAVGGTATVAFTPGTGQADSNIKVYVDWDNDGDFDQSVEDVTPYVMSLECSAGRDFPSQITGRASPGKLSMVLDNTDNRFSYFNTASPLGTAPFSLKTGRKMRVQTTSAANPDPVTLAADRFRRRDADQIGTSDNGLAWSEKLAATWRINDNAAEPSTEGSEHLATVDVGVADYYAQVTFETLGRPTEGVSQQNVSLIFRYQDTNNYSAMTMNINDASGEAELEIVDKVAGVATQIVATTIGVYDPMTVGVRVTGTSGLMYLEGTLVFSFTAIQTDETEVGIHTLWATGQTRPRIRDFYVWSALPADTEGILWTGDLADLVPSTEPGPRKIANAKGEGWLARLAGQEIDAPENATALYTPWEMGRVLAAAHLLHPPHPMSGTYIQVGSASFSNPTGNALEFARRFEETEFGFLHERNEGWIGFDERGTRDAKTSQALFSDRTGDQFNYTGISPLDQRRNVVNRVTSGLAPTVSYGSLSNSFGGGATASGVANDIAFTFPSVNDGDLIIYLVASSVGAGGMTGEWSVPIYWVQLRNPNKSYGLRVYYHVCDGTEDSSTVTIYDDAVPDGGSVAFVYYHFQASTWLGTDAGIQVAIKKGSNPPAILPSWGRDPAWYIAVRAGIGGASASVSGLVGPNGYFAGGNHFTNGAFGTKDVGIQWCHKRDVASVEDPSSFGGTFSGFDNVESAVVAIRGFNGDPPAEQGRVTVTTNDTDSQEDHNAVLEHINAANLFASETAAETYNDLVLDRFSRDRPILQLTFVANKNSSYRTQAVRRRVSDKVTVKADGNAGLGVVGDSFIEHITHRFSNGTKLWEVTWDLSPA